MSRHGSMLDLSPPAVAEAVEHMVSLWPEYEQIYGAAFPRSKWLKDLEDDLRVYYPDSSSADRRLTARNVAPFYLAAGHNVP